MKIEALLNGRCNKPIQGKIASGSHIARTCRRDKAAISHEIEGMRRNSKMSKLDWYSIRSNMDKKWLIACKQEYKPQRALSTMANTTADLVPFETLLDSTNEGIYGIDTEGRCTFLNRAGSRMLGFTRYEVLGRNMHRLDPPFAGGSHAVCGSRLPHIPRGRMGEAVCRE